MSDEKLTIKQENYCQQYVLLGNQTEAYKQSYNAENMKDLSIGNAANRLMKQPKIIARIKYLRDLAIERNKITLDEVVLELANMIRFDPADLFDEMGAMKGIHEMPKPVRQMLAGLDVSEIWEGSGENRMLVGEMKKIKIIDKLGVIEKLMKHLGGYEKHNKTKPGTVVQYQLPENGR